MRILDWLRDHLRGWLEVPTLDEAIDATRQLYIFWERRMQERERRFEKGLKDREKLIARREADMERLVGETTLAVERTITAIQEAEMNWKAVVRSQEMDKENEKQND